MSRINPACRRFIEDVAIQSMMGSALALVQIPEAERAKFIDKWASDAAELAMKVHEKLEEKISAFEETFNE